MKVLLFLLFLILPNLAQAQEIISPEELENEKRMINRWEDALAESAAWPDHVKLDNFGRGLRQIGSLRSQPGYSDELDSTYNRIQHEVLRIPGNAQYFIDKINVESDKFEKGEDFSRLDRVYSIATLGHIPIPESIKGLGELLWDERGRTPSGGELSNAQLAAQHLSFMNIRDKPAVGDEGYFTIELVGLYRNWYKRIKSGDLALSFTEQTVEFRLRPDGTWETTPRAISDETQGNKLTPAVPPAAGTKFPPAEVPTPFPAPPPRWPWFVAGALVLLAASTFVLRKSNR